MTPDSSPAAIIARLLEEHGLSESTRLYREALFSTLAPTNLEGVFRHAANPEPRESVIDVYAEGHIVQAERMGPGLAFAESASPNWQETMELHTLRQTPGEPLDPHVEVGVTIGELLAQGGRMYPVESVVVERAWYFTLPSGGVEVRVVS